METDLPELMTLADLTSYLKCKPCFVYRLTREGRIKFTKVGRELRFRRSDVVEFIEGCFAEQDKPQAPPKRMPGRPRGPLSGPRRR